MLDLLTPDPPTNAELRALGPKLRLYPGLPEMFTELEVPAGAGPSRPGGVRLEHYIISSGLRELLGGQCAPPAS